MSNHLFFTRLLSHLQDIEPPQTESEAYLDLTRTERLKVVYKIEKEFEYFMKYLKKIMVLTLAGLALASCVNPSKTSEPAGDGDSKTVTIGYTQFPENIDPAAEYNGWFTVRYGVGETLFKMDDKLEVKPWLAEKIEAVSDLEWKITLKERLSSKMVKK